jgi:AcrR family transcriptional regulator
MARAYAPRMAPEDRRDQLLEAALELISEQGYGTVTIEALANRVGVTRPVVYGVFENLDDLLATLLDRYEERTMAQLTAALQEDAGSPGEFIRGSMAGWLESIQQNPDAWRVILRADDSGAPREVRRRYWRGREGVKRLFDARLSASLGDAAASVDTEIIAEAVIALGVRGASLMLDDPENYPRERLTAMVDVLARSVENPALAT